MEFYTNVQLAGDKVICRGYRDGKRFKEVIKYKPYVFLPVKDDIKADAHTVYGEPVGKLEFDSIKEAREFVKKYEGVTEFEYYGLTYWQYPFINDRFPGPIEFDPSWISIVSLDIEVASPNGFPNIETADQPITAITLTKNGAALTFGTKEYTSKDDNHMYVKCDDEVDMLTMFLKAWSDTHSRWRPDVVTGWYIEFFDIPYLVHRIQRILGEEAAQKLSPNRWVSQREVTMGKNVSGNAERVKVYDLSGLTILDYQQLYKRFSGKNQESYSLDHISKEELGEGKQHFEGTLDELYEDNFEEFIDYNLRDAFLVERLEAKLKFIQLVMTIAYRAKINYIDAMTTARPWDVIIHNFLFDRGMVIPQTKPVQSSGKIRGAFVKEVVPGLYKYVVSVDFDSLYPRIISGQNISNETLADMVKVSSIDHWLERGLKDYTPDSNLTLCGNGARFRKDKRGFIPELVDGYIEARTKYKKEMLKLEGIEEAEKDKTGERANRIKMLDNFQKSFKILTNGLYGALSMKYFRWYDVRLGEAVTLTGQLAVRWVLNALNDYLNKVLKTDKDYIIAADTDSCYIDLSGLVEWAGVEKEQAIDFLDKVMKERISPLIDAKCLEISEHLNAYHLEKLHMKREALCDKAIWRAKKNYILNVWDSEGTRYKQPKIKMKGIETVRSSTPKICRDAIKKCIEIIMNKEEKDLQKFVAEFKEEFHKKPFEQIAFPRSVNGIQKYWSVSSGFRPKTPPNVRGSVTYNNLLIEKNLTGQYHLIKDKDKIKWAWLKTPNPFQSTTLAIIDELPPEFGAEPYVDYEEQYQTAFLNPIMSITDVIGWKTKFIPTLKKFWSKANGTVGS